MKPTLSMMGFFKKCHNNPLILIATVLLLCLALPTLNYFSLIYGKSTIIVTNCNATRHKTSEKSTPIVDQEATMKRENDSKSVKIDVKQDHCSGRYIYMYDLPPKFNQNLLKNCQNLSKWHNFCPYVENDGFGPWLNKTSWYHTDHFMLSVIFHNRMKQYECLTSNSSLASAIYAPFYPGLDLKRFLWGGSTSVKDATALDFVNWLKKQHEWSRVFGKDHFFVTGRIDWDFKRTCDSNDGWGNKLLNLPEVKNMTVLLVESGLYESNEFAIPYPTYFHPSNISEVLQWQNIVRRSAKKRAFLFSFAGAPRPYQNQSIRGELISQCKDAALRNRCNLVSCMQNNSKCNTATHIIEMFMQSVFCLQPPGDSYTRRSTFDSILAGCIPVFFHPGSAYVQYLWHFPKNYTKYSVFIPKDGVKNGTVRVEELLSQISEEEISSMREEVIRLIPRIIYARKKLDMVEDAFDVAVRKVLERIEDARGSNNSSENVSRNYNSEGKLKGWSYFF